VVNEVRFDRVAANVIGLLADTHCQTPADLPAEVFQAFRDRGAGLIVHIGHYGTTALLDRLAEVAPVMATTTMLDQDAVSSLGGAQAERVAGYRRVIESGGVCIGIEFDLSGKAFATTPEDPPLTPDGRAARDVLAEKFGRPVQVVASANTHVDRVSWLDGVLLVNPGSPNLPGGDRSGGLGTVAILRIDNSLVDVEIVDLERVRRGRPNS
jgi:predicted phosphodiesterase